MTDSTIQAVRFDHYGEIDVLNVVEVPRPHPGPGRVVVDEVAGQLATLLATGADLRFALLGFLVFRALDIVKPPPARQFERLPGGWGIMADDLMAGLYGNLILQVVGLLARR